MALFEPNDKTDVRKYIAIMDNNGENQVGSAFPVSNLDIELFAEALRDKGLKVEVREKAGNMEKPSL